MTWLLTETTTVVMPEASESFFVDDYSGVFTQETEQYIFEQAVALANQTKAQIVVVAVPNTGDETLESYSNKLANEWKIGDKEEDNGLLILFTTEEAHVRMEVGYGLEGCLPDSKSGRILDNYAVDDMNDGRFNTAAVNTFRAAAEVVYEEYGLQAPAEITEIPEINEERTDSITMADMEFPGLIVEKNEDPLWLQIIDGFFVFWMLFFIPFIIIAISIFVGGIQTTGRGGYHHYGGWGSGGFGGGSSGGGFSGGGGSFGGGGASR